MRVRPGTIDCWMFCSLLLTAAALTTEVQAFQARVITFDLSQGAGQQAVPVAIFGAVHKPACYEFAAEATCTLETAVTRAGGLRETAGGKIRVSRGGQTGMVLMYPAMKNYELRRGDLVFVEHQRPSTARVIHYNTTPGEPSNLPGGLVQRADYVRPTSAQRGHVVLLNARETPVVMPLWETGLTVDRLLTTFLKQDPAVAAQTRLLAGHFPADSERELQDGMVLQLPRHLVRQESFPELPPIVSAQNASAATEMTFDSPANLPGRLPDNLGPATASPLPLINPGASRAARSDSMPLNSPGDARFGGSELEVIPARPFSVPSLDALQLNSEREPQRTESPKTSETLETGNSFRTDTGRIAAISESPTLEQMFDRLGELDATAETSRMGGDSEVRAVPDFEALLAEKQNGPVHTAALHEVVPKPRDVAAKTSLRWPGMLAGGIVLFGVLFVVASAVKNQLPLPQPAELWRQLQAFSETTPRPAFQPGPLPRVSRSRREPEPVGRDSDESVPHVAVQTPALESETTEAMSAAVCLEDPIVDQTFADWEECFAAVANAVEEQATESTVAERTEAALIASGSTAAGSTAADLQGARSAVVDSTAVESTAVASTAVEATEAVSVNTKSVKAELADGVTPASEPVPAPVKPRIKIRAVASPVVPRTSGTKAADKVPAGATVDQEPRLAAQWPIVEQQVEWPRELQFFGKPTAHYEFRIDAAHEIPRPHHSPVPRKEKSSIDAIIDRCQEPEAAAAHREQAAGPAAHVAANAHNPELDSAGLFASAYALQRENQSR